MIYDSNNPLSDEELDKLGNEDFDSFLKYLDSKAEYLKGFTKPLGSYETKRFAAMDAQSRGEDITNDLIEKASKIGKVGDESRTKAIIDKMNEKGFDEPDLGVKNHKTNRGQWFE
tara:strand:+ start:38 stop:382 length:345 start_codon:yes stop_codon:yes gene_type:complete